MTDPVWDGVTIDYTLLQNYGWYTSTVTVGGQTYPRLVGYQVAGLREMDAKLTTGAGYVTAAATSATNAASSASTATTQAGISTSQAALSTAQAVISTNKAAEAAASALTAAGLVQSVQPSEIAGIDPSVDFVFSSSAALPAGVLTSASAKYVFDRTGALSSVAAGTPPIDYNPTTSALRGLRVEAAATNLILGSAAPSTQTVSVTAQAYTLSFYGTGTITLSGAYSGTLTGTGAFPAQASLTFTPTAGTLTLTVSGTVQYAMLTAGSAASSYIPTVGSIVTRAVDANSVALSSIPGWSATEVTVYVEFSVPSLLTTQRHPVALHDGSGNNQLRVGWMNGSSGGTSCGYLVVSGGANQAVVSPGGIVTAGALMKVACSLRSGRAAQSVNGAAAVATTISSLPTGLTTLQIGARSGPAEALDGWVRRITIFPRALSDATLQLLTA